MRIGWRMGRGIGCFGEYLVMAGRRMWEERMGGGEMGGRGGKYLG